MEDWEEFFREKSRRRADKDRLRSKQNRGRILRALGVAMFFLLAMIILLGLVGA